MFKMLTGFEHLVTCPLPGRQHMSMDVEGNACNAALFKMSFVIQCWLGKI